MFYDAEWTGSTDVELSADGREVVLRGPAKPPLVIQLANTGELQVMSPFDAVKNPSSLLSTELTQSLRSSLVFAEWVSTGEFGVALRLRHFALFAPAVLDALMSVTLLIPNSNGIDAERLRIRARRHLLSIFLCAALCCGVLSGSLIAMNSVWPLLSSDILVWVTLCGSLLFAGGIWWRQRQTRQPISPWCAAFPFVLYGALLVANGALDESPAYALQATIVDLEEQRDVDQVVAIVSLAIDGRNDKFTHDIPRAQRVPMLHERLELMVKPGALGQEWLHSLPALEQRPGRDGSLR